jgi:hypothetical protein
VEVQEIFGGRNRRLLASDVVALRTMVAEGWTSVNAGNRLGFSASWASQVTKRVHALLDELDRLHVGEFELRQELGQRQLACLLSLIDAENKIRRDKYRLPSEWDADEAPGARVRDSLEA